MTGVGAAEKDVIQRLGVRRGRCVSRSIDGTTA